MRRLADTPLDHPALWGDILVAPASSITIDSHATMLPHLKRRGAQHWWVGHQHGAYDETGRRLDSFNDKRGQRHIFQPPTSLTDVSFEKSKATIRDLVVYGGTIFDHFGHLLLDLTRLYQMARLYRHCKVPIWVHVHSTYPGKGVTSPIAREWFNILGMDHRIKVIKKPIKATTLVSSNVLYRDRCFVSENFHSATSSALSEIQQEALRQTRPKKGRIAYLSRHKLTSGTTKFIQENELVERISCLPEVDIICPEELDFKQKLSLYRSYEVIVGFPQACMNLKTFVPQVDDGFLAKQIMLISGPNSLSSNWINIDKACGFNDYYSDCQPQSLGQIQTNETGFQRGNQFDVNTAHQVILEALELRSK